jgi:carbon storage regulator CsrA
LNGNAPLAERGIGGIAMLILTRGIEESVAVGGSSGFEHLLKVTVLEIGAGSVKLGFEIDSTVPVHRWELWERLLALSEDHELEESSSLSMAL